MPSNIAPDILSNVGDNAHGGSSASGICAFGGSPVSHPSSSAPTTAPAHGLSPTAPPPAEFTQVQLRRAIGFLWTRVGWDVQLKSAQPFRLRIRAPSERAKRYFRNDPTLSGDDRARALVAQAVLGIARGMSRCAFDNAVIDSPDEGVVGQLAWLKKDSLRSWLEHAVARGGEAGLRDLGGLSPCEAQERSVPW